MIKNLGLCNLSYKGVDNFTSKLGLLLRRVIHRPLVALMKGATDFHIASRGKPDLDPKKAYIFASTHSFMGDAATALLTLPRQSYVLFGDADQLCYNRQVYAVWLNGMVCVDISDKESRRLALPKMERVLKSGTSIFLCPEGCQNPTESVIMNHMFPGVHTLAKASGCCVVPVASYKQFESDTAFISYGQPLDIGSLDQEEGMAQLRDALATLRYELIEEHPVVQRDSLPKDPRRVWMMEKRAEALAMNYQHDFWHEIYNAYQPKITTPDQVWGFLDDLTLNQQNARHLAHIKVEREKEKAYDLIGFMKKTWKMKAEDVEKIDF